MPNAVRMTDGREANGVILLDGALEGEATHGTQRVVRVYVHRKWSRTLVSPHALLKLRRMSMNPAHDPRWVRLHASLLHPFGWVREGDPVLARPQKTDEDDPGREARRLEHELCWRLDPSCCNTVIRST